MTLPINPEVENVLRSCASTIQDILLPEVESQWGRYSANLCVASLEYAIGQLGEKRNEDRRSELAEAIDSLRPALEGSDNAEVRAALAADSPFEAASGLLVAGQNEGGPLADQIKEILHPLLYAQLDREMGNAMPLFIAFAKNMAGAQ